jgi:hypothetical protein
MALDWESLGGEMLSAVKKALGKKWPKARDYAKVEVKKLGDTLVLIEQLYATGKITEEEARLHLQLQKNAARTVLLTLEGLGMLAAEAAINAALEVVRAPVNKVLGFELV